MVLSGRIEDAVVMLGDDIIHTTRSTILKWNCFHIAMLLMSVLVYSKVNHNLNNFFLKGTHHFRRTYFLVQLYGWLVLTVIS